MDWERQCMRLCAGVLACAVGLRLAVSGAFAPVGRMLQSPETVSFFFYLQTGRSIRSVPGSSGAVPETEPPASEAEPERPSFRGQEAEDIPVTYNCRYRPELEELLTRPLDWDLTGDAPAVLILHTHATEAYTGTDGEQYQPSGDYRTLDGEHNMLCLGELVARRLEEAGIRCVHDRSLHDYPDYSSAYTNAAAGTQALLEQYPTVKLVLDLHRDAADTAYGQMVTECAVGSERSAQLMLVVGTDAGGRSHPNWEENLSLALKLQVLLERNTPGICRPLNLTYNRYNQHLGHRALLVEIGAAGNTLEEARLAAEKLAQALIGLKYGTE